jgi:hypothetical protein
MGSRAEPAISPLTDPSYADLEDYFEKVSCPARAREL